MRVIKLLSTAVLAIIAVTAGLVVAAAIALFGFAVYLATRLFGNTRVKFVAPRSRNRSRPAKSTDAIDVTATEVTPEQTHALPTASAHDNQFRA